METNEKLGFFKKVKISIFNLEKYGLFITEKLSHSIKYIIILVLICTICFSILDSINIMKMFDKGINYLKNEMPDFILEDGEIIFESKVDGYDKEYDIKVLSLEKNNLTDSELKEYMIYEKCIIFLKDKIVFVAYGEYIEHSYNYIKESFDVEITNKESIIKQYNELGGNTGISITMFMSLLFMYFIGNCYEIAMYVLIVAILGYFVAQIGKIRIKFSTAVTLAIHSLTLSIALDLIYRIQYNFTGFEISYFIWLYLVIAYIYIVAAIFIIKADLIKQVMELQRIQEEQKNIIKQDEKIEEPRKEEKQDKNEEDKEKEENDNSLDKEPDGSEI